MFMKMLNQTMKKNQIMMLREPLVNLDNPQPKNKRYDKRDFIARKHGKEREPWVQKPMLFLPKSTKKNDDEEFERFAENAEASLFAYSLD